MRMIAGICAGLALIFVPAACSRHRDRPTPQCGFGDFSGAAIIDDPTLKRALSSHWLANARYCTIGELTLVSPADPAVDAYVVIRADKSEVVRLDAFSLSINDDHLLSADLYDRDKDGKADAVSYATKTHPDYRSIMATDFDLDGQPDIRRGARVDGTPMTEVWVGGSWRGVRLTPGQGMVLADDPSKKILKDPGGRFVIADAPQ